jgi:serine/threonine-protein kinase
VDEPPEIVTTELTVGQLSNTYNFLGQIGSGGMGVIYRAHHAMLNKDVAIKILHQVNDLTVQRFQREAQAAYNLHHENVVAVHEFGVTEQGQPYMVMEFIDGKTLSSLIDERGALPIELCINIFKQVCNGIVHAHARGVLHRDLKPSNVMLSDPESWSPHVRIVDFGIAKVLDSNDLDSGKLTRTGDFMGSPMYMSPEQCLGKNVDLRSDIYSIGCIMFEALTGRPPLQGETSMETMLMQMNDKAPSLKEGSGGKAFPVWMERLVARALAKDPGARFGSADELKKALEERVVADVKAPGQKDRGFTVPKSLRLPIIATAVALSAVAGLSVFLMAPRPVKKESKMPSQVLAEQFPNLKFGKKKTDGAYNDFTLDPSVISPPTHDEVVARNVADREQTKISTQWQTINDSALSGLKDRVDINTLELAGSKISDKALEHAHHLPLIRIELNSNPKITNKVLNYIKSDFLEELDLSRTGFNGDGIPALSKFENLRTLALASDHITDPDLTSLKKLVGLINLDLSDNPKITDAALSVISKLPKLRQLNLTKTGINGQGLTELRNLRDLSMLNIGGTKVDDRGVVAIHSLPLTVLNLFNTAITDGALESIAKIKTLHELGLQGVPLSLASMKLIAALPLNSLILYQCDINNEDLAELSRCKTLRDLKLSGNRSINGAGIDAIAMLPLQEIFLVKTQFTDNDLPHFYNFKELRSIDFTGCPGVTQDGANRLKAALHHDCSVLPFDTPSLTRINFGAAF